VTLTILTAVCGALDITERWISATVASCTSRDLKVVVVSNGNSPEEVEALNAMLRRQPHQFFVVNLTEPMGSTRAFNAGLEWCTGDVVAMLHNDLMVKEEGWDQKVLEFFEQHPETGVVGFHGARGVGSPDIYRTPYRLVQLARWDTFSNMVNAEDHGARVTVPRRAAVLDGMALIARRADLEAWGGLDESIGPHHLYDLDLCLRALKEGRMNYMLPISVDHVGGQTANFPRYNQWAQANGYGGGDSDVHRRAHEIFYEKWRGRLPLSV